jgi:glutaminyl-peptide cyclotransferase
MRCTSFALLLAAVGCASSSLAVVSYDPPEVAPTGALWAIDRLPHDTTASTQGLVYLEGSLIESTGGYGSSSLRRVPVEHGGEYLRVNLPDVYYGEGVTELNSRLYQLTWQARTGFIYEASSLGDLGTFTYDGQGWGITTDGKSLIMSDGTNNLRFLDPETFTVTAVLEVQDGGHPVRNLNELEWIEGEVWANVWLKEKIAVIDPITGKVRIWLDLSPFAPDLRRPSAVANGIAYDAENRRVFLTGKLWPHIFVVALPDR